MRFIRQWLLALICLSAFCLTGQTIKQKAPEGWKYRRSGVNMQVGQVSHSGGVTTTVVEKPKLDSIESRNREHQKSKGNPIAPWAPANLQRHWEKHGAEFPEFQSAQEYGDFAMKFFQYPPAGTLTKVNEAGDRLYYYEKLNIFGVTTDKGVPKTMFKPNAGIRYWRRQ